MLGPREPPAPHNNLLGVSRETEVTLAAPSSHLSPLARWAVEERSPQAGRGRSASSGWLSGRGCRPST